jgi:hypothetical protein
LPLLLFSSVAVKSLMLANCRDYGARKTSTVVQNLRSSEIPERLLAFLDQ